MTQVFNSDDRFDLAIEMAKTAGDMVRQFRSKSVEWQYKEGVELVTSADKAVDDYISQAISAQFPVDQILAEESNPDKKLAQHNAEALWIIDPIDGTVNFARGQFQVGVSIAFAVKGEVQFGVVYCPFYNELFTARKGQGARLNGQTIEPSQTDSLNRAIVATGFPYQKANMELLFAQLEAVLSGCADIRRVGSAACDLCWVAAGRLDGYYECLSPWDFAAAILIAREAGAYTGHLYGCPPKQSADLYGEHIIVANPKLYQPLMDLIHAQTVNHPLNRKLVPEEINFL